MHKADRSVRREWSPVRCFLEMWTTLSSTSHRARLSALRRQKSLSWSRATLDMQDASPQIGRGIALSRSCVACAMKCFESVYSTRSMHCCHATFEELSRTIEEARGARAVDHGCFVTGRRPKNRAPFSAQLWAISPRYTRNALEKNSRHFATAPVRKPVRVRSKGGWCTTAAVG